MLLHAMKRAFATATRSAQSLHLRCLSTTILPEKVTDTNFAEFVRLASDVPLLVRLRERGWGALAQLPASKLSDAGYSADAQPTHIAVVRDAFAAHDESPRSLSASIQPLGPHRVAIAADITEHHQRLVVDQYELNSADKHYHLTTIGTDLIRFLRGHGIHIRQVVDVQAAANAITSHDSYAAAAAGLSTHQSTNEVLMVAPTAFVFNQQAAEDNAFMNTETGALIEGSVTRQVLKEFAGLYHVLTEVAGVKVNLFQHSLDHGTPDAVFPNNWFSTHPAGEAGCDQSTLVYYPMKCPNRQAERRVDIRAVLERMGYDRVIDFSGHEKEGKYFEGTGVLVIDRVRGVAYVALSERAHPDLVTEWVETLGYKEAVTFHSTDKSGGTPVYHTNVMMAIGTSMAVVCLESIADDKERAHFVSKLGKTHEIVDISRKQMAEMCGNVLELEDGRGVPILAMSTRAYNAFTDDQRKTLRRHVAALHHVPINTLEYVGGGGVRCTLAEVFR